MAIFALTDGKRIGSVSKIPQLQQGGLHFSEDGTEMLLGDERLSVVMRVPTGRSS